jgi:hypothetical protein
MRDLTSRLPRILFVLGVLAVAGVRAADACTCIGMATCGDLTRADAVFEATIVSIEDRAGMVGATGAASATSINGGGSRIVTLKDVRAWRGEAPAGIYTGQGGGDCGYDFQAGERYLIEATRSRSGVFSTGICSVIRRAKHAGPVIEYLKALKEAPTQTRVMGTVARITGWGGFENALTPVKDAQVTLRGPKQATLSTDAEGYFVVTGLPEGMYDVMVSIDGKPLPPDREWSQFLLGRDGQLCEELSIAVPATGSVEVVILGEDGAPMRGAFVYLHSADHVDKDGDRPGWGLTLPEGHAVVEEIPPGRYVLAMNPGSGPMPGSPYLETFSPVFVIENGKIANPPPLRPTRATSIKISGVVRDAAGVPLAGVQVDQWIQLSNGKRSSSWPHPKTDAQGRFQVDLWKDQRYVITAGPERDPWGRIEFVADGRPIEITARPR